MANAVPICQTTGRRKRAVARVRIRPGAGTITVNTLKFEDYFTSATHRMIVTEPLRLTETTESWNIDVTIDGGGVSGQAGAFRLGIARALCELDPELRAQLKKAGFLTRDSREKESKKYGLKKARKAPQYSKRNSLAKTRFGTDGVRGIANVELTPELVMALGRAIARTITATTFLIGRDTRRSGPMIQAGVSAGLASEGADVVDVRVLATPALAWLSALRDIPAVVISASHNPFADNGVKVFAAGGAKLSEEIEAAIEEELERILDPVAKGPRRLEGHGVGRLTAEHDLADSYVEHLCSLIDGRSLEGLRLVVDSANGAASGLAARVFEGLGAEVVAIGCDPDGTNINDGCGSTSTATLASAVVEHQADLGLALDGDADRLLAVDSHGNLVNGDELLALFALDLAERGQLAGNTIVVTVMTNLGFRMAMDARHILVKETAVGDRYVLAALDKDGFSLGGEQSGHIIFRRLSTTGDGLLTGLILADLVKRSKVPLADQLEGLVTRVPQVLVNVRVSNTDLLATADAIWSAVAEEEERLGESGRVLLRPSGTEPLVRVMVEATGDGVAEQIAQRLSTLVEFELQAAAATT